jgi:peroxiredoxin Q/BCP
MVAVGDEAPDFELMDQGGNRVRLSQFRGRCVVLYFFPRAFTPGCTREACGFRDSYEAFAKAGAVVIGVSSDSVDTLRRFSRSYNLPFILLSDEGSRVRKLYGVPSTLGILPGRVTYVIDPRGRIVHVFNSQFRPGAHIKEALSILRNLRCIGD